MDNDRYITMNSPFEIHGVPNENGVIIVVDHASNKIPAEVSLGLSPNLMTDHIAHDIGTSEIAKSMSQNSQYIGFLGGFSRLLVDLNRYPDEPSVIPIMSDGVEIPGNQLDEKHRSQRLDDYYHPYHSRLKLLIGELKPRLLLSLHSFSPVLRTNKSVDRPWDIGILYNDYDQASKLAIQHLEYEGLKVGDQLPYSGKDLNATMNRQAESIGQPYFGVEVRQDLISNETGQQRFAEILQRTCDKVLSALA
ncbi:MAG: N-formylglutamate amidohydrolase [Parasphingorhabdus sp.]